MSPLEGARASAPAARAPIATGASARTAAWTSTPPSASRCAPSPTASCSSPASTSPATTRRWACCRASSAAGAPAPWAQAASSCASCTRAASAAATSTSTPSASTRGRPCRAGEMIGTVGRTGVKVSGSHLHFEVHVDGELQGPGRFPRRLRPAARADAHPRAGHGRKTPAPGPPLPLAPPRARRRSASSQLNLCGALARAPSPETSSEAGAAHMIGQFVGGYRIVAKLGEGGMGVVYRAEHRRISRARRHQGAARRTWRETPKCVERFFNEARAATADPAPRHRRDLRLRRTAPTGSAYIVMELLEGESLARLPATRGPLTPAARSR